jgi:hypothetical protein
MPLVVATTDFLQLPVGTTAERPGSPVAGMMRINTTTNALEFYSGTGWVVWKAL